MRVGHCVEDYGSSVQYVSLRQFAKQVTLAYLCRPMHDASASTALQAGSSITHRLLTCSLSLRMCAALEYADLFHLSNPSCSCLCPNLLHSSPSL